jgi:hypothetical protein
MQTLVAPVACALVVSRSTGPVAITIVAGDLQRVKRFVHRHGGSDREQVGYTQTSLPRQVSVVRWHTDVTRHDENLAPAEQFACGFHGYGKLAPAVLNNQRMEMTLPGLRMFLASSVRFSVRMSSISAAVRLIER